MGIDQEHEAGAERVRRADQIAQILTRLPRLMGLLMPSAPMPK
jgi:hypothetical protein